MNEDIRSGSQMIGQENGKCDAVRGTSNACDEAPRTIRAVVNVRANLSLEDVLGAVKLGGQRATRAGWNAGGQHIESQHPDKGSRMSAPYLVLKNAQSELVPWVPSQGDLFARDWAILPR